MMMYSVELYRKLGGGEFDPGWTECGGIRLACSPERWEETRRQAGWAKTFGLPLELISAERGAGALPADGHRRACSARRWLPTDGYLDPSQLTYALADGARRGGCAILTEHARHRDRRRATARVRGVRTDRGDIEADVVVNAGGMFAAEIGRLAGVRDPGRPVRPRVPRDAAVPRSAAATPPADACATPTSSIYFREEGGGPGHGRLRARVRAVGARRRRAGSTRSRPTSTAACSRRTGTASRRSSSTRASACPAMEDVKRHAADQRAGGVHARRRVLPRRDRGRAGCSSPPGFCAHGLAGAGGIGKVMAEWIVGGRAVARPLAHGHPPLRRATTARRATRSPARARSTRPTTTSSTPTTSGRAGRPLRRLARVRVARRARRGVRREVGLGAGQLVRGQRGGGRRVAAPARLGGHALVAGDRRRAPRLPRGRRAVRRVLVRQARGRRPGRGGVPRAAVRQPRRARGRAGSPTRRCSTGAAGSSATSP